MKICVTELHCRVLAVTDRQYLPTPAKADGKVFTARSACPCCISYTILSFSLNGLLKQSLSHDHDFSLVCTDGSDIYLGDPRWHKVDISVIVLMIFT